MTTMFRLFLLRFRMDTRDPVEDQQSSTKRELTTCPLRKGIGDLVPNFLLPGVQFIPDYGQNH